MIVTGTGSATADALTEFVSWWRRVAPRDDLSTTDLSVLDVLDREGPLRLTDLAARERLTQPGMTALVTRGEAADLVRRSGDPEDRRVALVSVTDAGRDRLAAVRSRRSAELGRRLAGLPAGDLRTLERALPALRRLMSVHPVPGETP